MFRSSSTTRRSVIAVISLALVAGCDNKNFFTNVVTPPAVVNAGFLQTNLVADVSTAGARVVDPNLVNSWGIAFGTTGALWVANNGTGTSTVYDAAGNKQNITVTIPGADPNAAGVPTGIVFNGTGDFAIPNVGPSSFIFAGEDGTIAAWGPGMTTAAIIADRSANDAVYKGITMASNGGVNFLYLTDFHNARVDMFDHNNAFVGSFTDPTIPAGFAPFGIANIAGKLYVTYAKQKAPDNEDDVAGAGNGYVVVFNADGTVNHRFVSQGALNSPWGVVMAPSGFGSLGGAILIGNFGDGRINAYDATTGAFIDSLRDGNGSPIVISGLWGLAFGPDVSSTTLYFAAGPGDESHGLMGTLTPR